MKFTTINPFELVPNPWNSNHVDRENFNKLKTSLERLGSFKPVVVRELETGDYQILGGFHRVEAAKELGWSKIDIIILDNVDDKKAKEITLIDNTRYGEDDEAKLQAILDDIGDLTLLEAIMPETAEIELPDIEVETPEDDKPEPEKKEETGKTLKFRFEDADKAEEIENLLARVTDIHDYKYRDGSSNLSDALYHVLIMEKE